ncbi:MAG: SAGA HAT/Core module component [Vezdaea aestivalis]|nr:MAG: SAGA HAT/Core module component [Vezdaea aestivalis]
MSVRTARPRNAPRDDAADATEERNLWSQIVGDVRKLQEINTRAAEVSQTIVEEEHDINPSLADVDRLQSLYREGVKLAEEEQEILEKDQPQGTIDKLGFLIAMRAANEAEVPRAGKQPNPRDKPSRGRPNDGASDAPASPKVSNPGILSRIKRERDNTRSGSVPSGTRDLAVKVEDVASASGSESVKGFGSEKGSHQALHKGQEVVYKQSKQKGLEGDWIQCVVLEVSGEGSKRKYESGILPLYKVHDPEPDDHGNPGQVYAATTQSLIPIPPEGTPLDGYVKGHQVLAQYPGTTTFYRAEVVGMKGDFCRLKFEGEDEAGKETDVRRRFVLDTGGR